MKFIKYPDIEQFRHVCASMNRSAMKRWNPTTNEVEDILNPIFPKLEFIGTTKVHGSNAGVAMYDGEMWTQKRTDICTIEKDNFGFAFFVEQRKEAFLEMFKQIPVKPNEVAIISGEICGAKVQGGVAITGLDKMFVVFDIMIADYDKPEDKRFMPFDDFDRFKVHGDNVYHIHQFGTWRHTIDFARAQESIPRFIELTDEIEEECPLGKHFGKVKGEDNTTGEGVVWKHTSEEGTRHMFKVKGEKHSSSKVKKIKVDVSPQIHQDLINVADATATVNRLAQACKEVFGDDEPDIRKFGDVMRWVMNDIMKEEMDVLTANNVEPKQLGKYVSSRVRVYLQQGPEALNLPGKFS